MLFLRFYDYKQVVSPVATVAVLAQIGFTSSLVEAGRCHHCYHHSVTKAAAADVRIPGPAAAAPPTPTPTHYSYSYSYSYFYSYSSSYYHYYYY